MDKLKELLSRCECGVHLTVNDHRDVYKTAAEGLDDIDSSFCFEVTPEMRAKIIETDTLIDLQFYPNTPNVFYKVLHYDIELALDEALAILALINHEEHPSDGKNE